MPLYVRTVRITAVPDDAAPWIPAHLDHLRQLRAAGRLKAAGGFTGDDGFLEIFEAADRLDAERTARSSPLIERGLCAWQLREWRELEL